MGSRGPAPKPNSSESKRRRNTMYRPKPATPAGHVERPEWVSSVPAACDFWDRVAPGLIADGRLLPEHADALGQLARLHADVLQLQDQVAAEGWISASEKGQSASPVAKLLRDARRDFVTLSKEFGLTAAAAARIPQEEPVEQKADTLRAFIDGTA